MTALLSSHDASWEDAEPTPFWLDSASRPAARPALDASASTDLLVVGGGFSGLWTALMAKERQPHRDVVLIEGGRIGSAASGRNGGFCEASLTHGAINGLERFPEEYQTLERLGRQNLDEMEQAIAAHGIECDFARVANIAAATEPYQVEFMKSLGHPGFLDRDAIRAEVNSPTYLAGISRHEGNALVNPAALAWGLADAAERLGVRIVENTPATRLRRRGHHMAVQTPGGEIRSRHVALGTNAFPSLLRRNAWSTVPVYDYVLVTEPLSAAQLESVGWENRQGMSDVANQFHYYRLTADNRILWGGYDAIYHYGRRIRAQYDQRPETFSKLAAHFFTTFPQLEGVRFTHRWGGAIDTCTRFCAFFGTAFSGQVGYALGYTGLGVGATRFGANVMLDLLDATPSERTALKLTTTRPTPFPPEPFAYAGIQLTRWALDRADRNQGKRNLWLRTLDRLGLGFDS
ncbi:NAD(P)/FAD-dependent oxidoreductase [Streptomyces sp. NPDC060065]|uniref:NAD(P)/FAD-dependent oxidoreductase n=1 Tax=Streptomyces sp. NPDC060065 TaxID=3347050 RepID=UPI00367C473B